MGQGRTGAGRGDFLHMYYLLPLLEKKTHVTYSLPGGWGGRMRRRTMPSAMPSVCSPNFLVLLFSVSPCPLPP